jgi:prepilin-type N-terminal cleavage/methylation domain-containing protein
MKLHNNSSGFGLFEVLIVLAVISVIGFAGWYIRQPKYNTNNSASPSEQVSNKNKTIEEQNLDKLFTDPTGLVSIKYPKSWIIDSQSGQIDSEHSISTTTLTSPQGTVFSLNLDWGGRGGGCEADDTDVPFQPGNLCNSVEYLGIESTEINNVYTYIWHYTETPTRSTFEKSNIVLATKHFADKDGNSVYVLGLTASNGNYQLPLNKPLMGMLPRDFEFEVWDAEKKFRGYIHSYAYFNSAELLDSEDAMTVKNILRSMTLNL